jgi:hypothetical protein
VSAPGDYDNGEIGGMIGKGNRSTRRKPAPVPLCPPQTPHAARTRTRAAAVGSQCLTAELRHGRFLRVTSSGSSGQSGQSLGTFETGRKKCFFLPLQCSVSHPRLDLPLPPPVFKGLTMKSTCGSAPLTAKLKGIKHHATKK